MLSLLPQTTLTITAALVLISCATQAQILNAPNLYARRYIEGKAAEEGLLDLQWVDGGVGRASSIAQLTYGGKPAYMTCTSSDTEKLIFDALVAARNRGVNKEYSNYVKNPLKSIPVPEGPSRLAGNCFIYNNISDTPLDQFVHERNYLDNYVILSQVLPQILKGFIYLYNVGITNIKIDLNDIFVESQNNGQLKATIFAFDVVGSPQPPTQQLQAAIMPAKVSSGSPSPYACSGFHHALHIFISRKMDLNIAANPLNITPEDRMRIKQYIKQKREADFRFSTRSTRTTLEETVAAYISLLQITTIATHTQDCSSFVATLRSLLVRAQQAHQPRPRLL